MSELQEKAELLEARGYRYWFERCLYVNRAAKKVFSLRYLETYSVDRIERDMEETIRSAGEWSFYFMERPSYRVAVELVEDLIRDRVGMKDKQR